MSPARPNRGDAHHAVEKGSKAAFWVVRARRVDVEIDDIDTALRLAVAIASVPRSIAQANVADLREPEATALTSGRQTLVASAAKFDRLALSLALVSVQG
jgi:hypothetical protein